MSGTEGTCSGTRLRLRVAAIPVGVLAVALVLSGCIVFKTRPTGAQSEPLGPVIVTTTVCASDAPGCTDADVFTGDADGNSGQTGVVPIDAQVLLGYRVPAGTTGPERFEAQGVAFERSPSYVSELTRLAPPGAGFEWIGYQSERFDPKPDEPGELTVSVPLALPAGTDGGPFAGPFQFRPVVGVRQANGSTEYAPVSCPAGLFIGTSPDGMCVDAPAQGGGPDGFNSYYAADTDDLGIVAGPAPTVKPGETAEVPFVARYAGDAPVSAALSAATTLPGAGAAPRPGSISVAASGDTPITVSVPVPVGIPAGTYEVELTATAGPYVRIGRGSIVVPGKCGGRPATIVGGDGNDKLKGTPGRDVIYAGGGKDKVQGKSGKDRLCGGAGNDKLKGGPGKDRLDGGKGKRDFCNGGGGRDKAKRCERGPDA